ncbi:hypothetical protein FF80_00889 [Devosia sp. LC5]|uniref:DUF302 domain-containing protein n=1 Tax=Devosia sp. LC5 TaxID=1502724 RepID=UPI0004E3A7FA|nr:DUF302 domain-containing protein [Devosia sp. LC5]KFC70617.1 hypothetical protein FF80_00889 [Devosia sp. LC5]
MTELSALLPNVVTTTPQHHLKVTSSYGFEETLHRLRQSISAADLWVIHEIDPQALLRKGGYAIPPLRQILWFHPRLMARLLLTDPGVVPEAPLKFVVFAAASGVTVTAFNPMLVFSPYPDLAMFASELFDITNRMLLTVSAADEVLR